MVAIRPRHTALVSTPGTVCRGRHPRRFHHRRTSHYHQQCQPVRQSSCRGGAGAQHSLLALPHHRQGCLRGTGIFQQRRGDDGDIQPHTPPKERKFFTLNSSLFTQKKRCCHHRRELRTRIHRSTKQDSRGRQVQGLHAEHRQTNRQEYHLHTLLQQRTQEHRRYAVGTEQHTDVRRAVLPDAGINEPRQRHSVATCRRGLPDGILPRSTTRLYGIYGFRPQHGVPELLR